MTARRPKRRRRGSDSERLDRPPFRLPRPRRRGVAGLARWAAAALLVGLAAALLTSPQAAGEPGSAELVPVLVAARDLAPGTPLRDGDVRTGRLPAPAVPSGVLRPGARITGRSVAGPVRRGEPMTDVRLMGPALVRAAAGAGAVEAAVRISDAGAVRLVHPGDRVDIIGTETQGGRAGQPRTVASDVIVVAVPPAPSAGSFGGDGALVVVATTQAVARRLAGAGVSGSLSIVVRGR